MYVSRPFNRTSECLDICRTELGKEHEWAKNNGLAINPLKIQSEYSVLKINYAILNYSPWWLTKL